MFERFPESVVARIIMKEIESNIKNLREKQGTSLINLESDGFL